MPSSSALHTVKRVYAHGAQAAGRRLTALGLLGEEPPPVEQRWRHWAYSLTKVHDSLGIARLDVPWWTYSSISEVTQWLEARITPVRVYEYGSGASTLWLARRAREVHSVEHHRGFGEMMQTEVSGLDNVSLRVVEPDPSSSPVIGSQKEGHTGLDFSAYVRSIGDVTGTFDLVVVDGRAREACLEEARPRLAPDGLVVFDNSRRRRYQQAIAASGMREQRYAGLTPTLPYPDQTSLLRP